MGGDTDTRTRSAGLAVRNLLISYAGHHAPVWVAGSGIEL
jgi:hypothetical protein